MLFYSDFALAICASITMMWITNAPYRLVNIIGSDNESYNSAKY